MIPSVVKQRAGAGRRVMVIDMTSIVVGDLKGDIYPSDQAYQRMADLWFAGMRAVRAKGWISASSVPAGSKSNAGSASAVGTEIYPQQIDQLKAAYEPLVADGRHPPEEHRRARSTDTRLSSPAKAVDGVPRLLRLFFVFPCPHAFHRNDRTTVGMKHSLVGVGRRLRKRSDDSPRCMIRSHHCTTPT
ncbi:MAG: hypothetical protein M1826_002972 [Phylliscum demangeonii]|nr:MAG: hypothetical protein M1826_002972 [Phylliscum demangeonii]